MNVAYQAAAVVALGASFYSLASDCVDWVHPDREPDAGTKFNCVIASITSAVGIVSIVDGATRVFGSISEWMQHNNIELPGLADMYHRWRYGPSKRELSRRKEDALKELSWALGAEVRHVGYWKDIDSGITKRDGQPQNVPVLGARINGNDLHFAYLGKKDGKDLYKMGVGVAVDETAEVEKRGADLAGGFIDGVFFTKGGLNFYGMPEPASPGWTETDKEVWLDTDEELGWLYDQTKCTLEDWHFRDPMKSSGLYFQVYNNVDQKTLSAGGIAPFGPTNVSAIGVMESQGERGGLDINKKCMAKLGMDYDHEI
jgi:hypothetical protein